MRRYLLTAESVTDFEPLAERLSKMPHKPTLRIPIQWDADSAQMSDPGGYVAAFKRLSEVADIMIQFVDSSAMTHMTPSSMAQHAQKCMNILRPYCNLAEIGNEVNGDWLGKQVIQKVNAARDVCRHSNLQTAITYYLSGENPGQMFDWIKANPLVSDYALISYYPNTSTHPLGLGGIFNIFAKRFPDSLVGWGEYGTEDGNGGDPGSLEDKIALIARVEQDLWGLASKLNGNYIGLGGYWNWASEPGVDSTFQKLWK